MDIKEITLQSNLYSKNNLCFVYVYLNYFPKINVHANVDSQGNLC